MAENTDDGNIEKLLSGIINVAHSRFNIFDIRKHDFTYSSNLIELLKALGYTKDEFLNLARDYANNLVHPDDIPYYENHVNLMQNSTGMTVFETEYRIKKGNGEYLWISSRDMVFERDEEGKPLKILGAAVSINDRKSLVAKIEENLSFLEKLSYKNSHDMRGPVATIKGLLQLAEQDCEQIKSETLLSFFKRCVNKLDDIIHEVNNEISDKSKQD